MCVIGIIAVMRGFISDKVFLWVILSDNSLKLEDQLWHEVKPGLSSYAEDPAKVHKFS